MSNEWELVVKGGKHKPQPKISNKEQKRIQQNNLNSNKYRFTYDEDSDKSLSPEQDKISSKPKVKKSNVTKNENDFNKQINKLNAESIKKIYSELLEKFPNQYTVSLLDLAVHISLMIKVSDEAMKSVNYDQIDFPYAFLSNDMKTALKNIFNKLSNVHISNFLKSAMIQFLDDRDKGIQSIGLRILMQVCVRIKSSIFITNRKDFFDLLNHYREQTVKFKLLTWVIKQACSNYNMACQIWLIYFLPFITQKCHTEFVISFGEEMRNYSFESTGNDTNLLVTDFVPIIDLIFSQNTDSDRKTGNKKKQASFQLQPQQIDRLKTIYPRIKDLAFLSKSSGALKDYFGSLFLRLSIHNKNALLNKELLDCLDHCLKMCPDSISHLANLHGEYPEQTKIFLDHLSQQNTPSAQAVKKSRLFKSVTDKIHSSTHTLPQKAGDGIAKKSKKVRQSNGCSSRLGKIFRWSEYILLMLLLVGGIVYFQYPKQFKDGQKFIKPHFDTAIDRLMPAYKYCEQHVLQSWKYVQPYALAAWQRVQEQSIRLWESVQPLMDDLTKNVIVGMRNLQEKLDYLFPSLMEQIGSMVQSCTDFVSKFIDDIVRYLNSGEFQELQKLIHDKMVATIDQFMIFCRQAIDYTMKMIGGN